MKERISKIFFLFTSPGIALGDTDLSKGEVYKEISGQGPEKSDSVINKHVYCFAPYDFPFLR